jgi:hypothetical protein
LVPFALLAQAGRNPLGEAAAAFLCVVVIGIPIILAIYAFILRLACQIVSAPVPDFGKAMLVVFVNFILGVVVQFGLGFVVGAGLAVNNPGPEAANQAQLMVGLISIPLGAVISAGVFSGMLEEVSFGKGLLIWLLQILIAIGIGLAIAAALFVVLLLIGVAARH